MSQDTDDSTERKPFKDLFDGALVEDLAARLKKAAGRRFSVDVIRANTADLESVDTMSGRVGLISDAIKAAFGKAKTADLMAALTASLPPPLQSADESTGLGHRFWPYGELIGRYGLDDVDASFAAMIELTQRFTSEFAVRPFLEQNAPDILDRMERLIDHPNIHVRRWISEGTRTRLPWGKRVTALNALQDRRLALLSRLRHDPERYVQRSVANHLGDIFKDDVAQAIATLRTWLAELPAIHSSYRAPDPAQPTAGLRLGELPAIHWICKHAARAPLKAGHPEVLALFGHTPSGVESTAFSVTPTHIAIGDTVTLRATVTHRGDVSTTCRLDYALTRPSKTHKPSRKVFRWADRPLSPGESTALEARYTFVPRTIRPVHPGPHTFELIIDGQVAAVADLTIT